jgi:hypothetical protein
MLCVNDTYDENHCREGDPLILPVEKLEAGDCVEVRTKSGSDEVAARVVNDEAGAAVGY